MTAVTDAQRAYIAYLEGGRQTNLSSLDPAVVTRQNAIDQQYAPPTSPLNTSPSVIQGDQSAVGILTDALDQAGLGSLASTVWDWWKQGRSLDQINLDVKTTPEYKTRFAGLLPLQAKGRAISEANYINLEQAYAGTMKAAGLPPSFYDQPSDFSTLISNEVSPAEFSQRVNSYTTLTSQMPREVLDSFAQQSGYANFASTGWSNGDLAAFFIDPDKALPAIQTRLQKAEIGGAAQLTGYGPVTDAEAGQLASQGVDFTKAQQGFGNLAQLNPLFSALPGEDPNATPDRATQLGAAFSSNAQDAAAIEQARQRRLSQFQSGGSLAANQAGTSGAGGAI